MNPTASLCNHYAHFTQFPLRMYNLGRMSVTSLSIWDIFLPSGGGSGDTLAVFI
jgi:hypothetical protein